jgi:hypothetical protein
MSNTRCEAGREKEYFASDHFFSFIAKKSFTHYPIHHASPAYYIYNPKYRIHIVFHIQINIYKFIHTNSYLRNRIKMHLHIKFTCVNSAASRPPAPPPLIAPPQQ